MFSHRAPHAEDRLERFLIAKGLVGSPREPPSVAAIRAAIARRDEREVASDQPGHRAIAQDPRAAPIFNRARQRHK
jgi:hypothetical protein